MLMRRRKVDFVTGAALRIGSGLRRTGEKQCG